VLANIRPEPLYNWLKEMLARALAPAPLKALAAVLQSSAVVCCRLLLANIRPEPLYNWLKEMLARALAPALLTSLAAVLQSSTVLCCRLLLANIRPELLYNWPKEMLALALAPALPPWPNPAAAGPAAAAAAAAAASESSHKQQQQQLPPGTVPWDRPLPQLLGSANVSGWCAHGWMVFENMVVVQDRYPLLSMPDRLLPRHPSAAAVGDGGSSSGSSRSGGSKETAPDQQQQDAGLWNSELRVGFNRAGLADEFRAAAHARHLWGPPLQQQQQQQHATGNSSSSSSASSLPRVVTVLLYPEDYPPVTNHYALVDMLRDLAEPYGFKVC
jgi:hypothetical protein